MFLISTGGVYPPQPQYFGDLFVETVPEAAQVLPKALEVASEVAANVSPMASVVSRALLWEGASSPEDAHLLESQVFHGMIGSRYVVRVAFAMLVSIMLALTCGYCSRDHQEGVESFFEKRNPEFTADLQNNHPMFPWWHEKNVGIEPKGTKEHSKL